MSDLIRDESGNYWTVVFTTPSRPEAHIIVGRLENEGILAIIDAEAGRDALGIHIGRFGEIRVLVHESHAAEAQAILDFIFVEADDQDTMELQSLGDILVWNENDFEDATGLRNYDDGDDEAQV